LKRIILLFIVFIFMVVGCNNNKINNKLSESEEIWKDTANTKQFDPWIMTSEKIDNKYGTYLGNGYLGIRLFSNGVANNNKEKTLTYMSGLYANENIIPTPSIADLRFFVDKNSTYTEFELSDKKFSQTLDMKNGYLSTTSIMTSGRKKAKFKIDTYVLRLNDNSCKTLIKVVLIPKFNGKFVAIAPVFYNNNAYSFEGSNKYVVKGKSLTKCLYVKQKFLLDHPKNTEYENLKSVVSGNFNQSSDFYINVEKNKKYVFYYTASVSKDFISKLAKNTTSAENEISIHKTNWNNLWKSDIVIDGDPVSQQVMHSNMFYLLCTASKDYSIPPMGLSMNAFNGHVFWDAETWMFPALVWQHPDLAKGILNYRIRTLNGAIENAKKNNMKGAEYAWESGESGIEAAPSNIDTIKERHINGDIAFAIWQYYVITGDKKYLEKSYGVLKNTADYWVSRVTLNPMTKKYDILGVCPPDENAGIINNSVYTNAIAQINLWVANEASKVLSKPSDPKWMDIANNITITVDKKNNKFMIYDGYKDGTIKQADPELLLYPLKYNEFVKSLDNYNFDQKLFVDTYYFYKSKVNKNGPSMSSSVHAVSSARLKSKDAYSDFINSYKPYMRGAYNYFNEKRSPTYIHWCFLTGAASSYASVLWGFCGLDANYYSNYEDNKLMYSNNLPSNWKKVTLKNIKYKNKTYTLIYENNKVVVKEM